MRIKNSIQNSIIAIFSNTLAILIGFLAQKIFISILGTEYLGLNGLFSNILSILSIAELGIGETIIFHLYKPLANNNIEEVKPLINFYKKAYNVIAIVILTVGICIIPFLKFFIGYTELNVNFQLIYILFLLQTVSSYLLTYKRSILYADQKNYIISLVHIVYLILLNTMQIIILYISKNYYLYLIIKIICILLENIIINVIANKKYPYLLDQKIKKIDKSLEKNIFRRVKAQLFHKIGGAVINGTDNIIISKFFGVLVVGVCSNYFLIISAIKNLFVQFILSITASVGNLLVEDNEKKSFEIYKKIRFVNFWVATFATTSLLVNMQDFMIVWLGREFLLSMPVLVVLSFNLYQKLMRCCNDVFLSAAGICVENRFVPIAEVILNILFSIILLKIFGLIGVFLGTIISGLALWCYSYPKYVYRQLFDKGYFQFIMEILGYILVFGIIANATYLISNAFVINNTLVKVISNCIVSIIVPNILLIIFFVKTDNFKYFMNLFNQFSKRLKKRKIN